jgi:hypothetical protein
MRIFTACKFRLIVCYYCDQIKDAIDGTEHERDEKYCITRNLIGKREGELSVDGRMILAWIVEK